MVPHNFLAQDLLGSQNKDGKRTSREDIFGWCGPVAFINPFLCIKLFPCIILYRLCLYRLSLYSNPSNYVIYSCTLYMNICKHTHDCQFLQGKGYVSSFQLSIHPTQCLAYEGYCTNQSAELMGAVLTFATREMACTEVRSRERARNKERTSCCQHTSLSGSSLGEDVGNQHEESLPLNSER